MDKLVALSAFFDKAFSDSRISIAHIGLYASLLQMWSDQGFDGPVIAFASKVMDRAKISSTATYHRLIRDLSNYGYIRYVPSFYKKKASEIYIN